ncbi:LysM peptidoglycan-binding domain-containing protein [Flavobacterium psychrotolerans]|uniref:Lytic transglycosylase n=1 Tax=Flavobacterium psychrotolerans TaxID=2169410 RepID=A0A2U1JKB0_9FLAO|nr:LysM peptidoglycan-binding domain-containing protein [Flavobacterium psychrotolerans]PWA05580.1 lytic transglycosylase [Flavobacterium psychrotolerans]
MNLKKITLSVLLLIAGNAFAQDISSNSIKLQSNISYLDSIKRTFINDNIASCVDSLWLKELTSLDLYNDLETDIKTINLDQKVDYELPTALLKARLKEMDAKSPFNIEYNQGLENIIKSFLKNRKKSFERLMATSEYYFPIFEEALSKQNVPLEIKYLAVVESALNPKAVSRVGATGLWQFMYQTGKQYNLNIDSYVDDRSDPLKASEAAAQYMTNMYKIFGDWDLVLASYNSGPGNVAKAIRRSGGQQNYWNIRKNLPEETQGYVPAFLATMYIYEYHKEHGIIPNRAIVKQFATDTIMIKKQMSFKQISDLLDIPVAQLQLLNPQYKLNVIPAYNDKKHFLRLPSQKIAVFTSNEEKIYAYAQRELDQREKPFTRLQRAFASRDSIKGDSYVVSKTKFHKVKRGDNLSEIADRYDVSMSQIKKWNKLKGNKAPLGRNLKIITSERIAVKEKKKTIDTISVTKNTESIALNSNTVVQAQTKEPKELKVYKEEKVVTFKDITTIYKVKKGDNLGEISDKYGVTIVQVKKWNKLKSNNVALGKKLKIITNEKIVTTVKKLVKSESIASYEKPKKDQKANASEKQATFYVVQQGDNLIAISRKYNVSVDDLKQLNNLEDNNIQLESKLKIADITVDEQSETAPKTEIKNVEYVIQKGDNLRTIASKNDVAISDLKTWNDLSGDNIQIGTKIIVGKKLIADANQAVVEKHAKKDKVSKTEKEDHYYVQKGDSLFSIAKKYPGITISDIKKWNRISGNELKPGMKLKING